MNRVSSWFHPVFHIEVGISLPHVVEATGAKLPGAANIGALPSALIAGDSFAESP